MSEFPLPERSVALSEEGFEKLYGKVRADRELAEKVLKAIEADPKGALHRAFRLTPRQRAFYDGLTDEKILKRAKPLLRELGGKLRPLHLTKRLDADPDDGAPKPGVPKADAPEVGAPQAAVAEATGGMRPGGGTCCGL